MIIDDIYDFIALMDVYFAISIVPSHDHNINYSIRKNLINGILERSCRNTGYPENSKRCVMINRASIHLLLSQQPT